MADLSFISNAHPNYIEGLYQQYKQTPDSLDGSWAQFFAGFEYAANGNNGSTTHAAAAPNIALSSKEFQVFALINAYRERAHFLSDTNPIRHRKDRNAQLALANFGLTDADLQTPFVAANELGLGTATLQQIIDKLTDIYLGHIGFEFMYIQHVEMREWLRRRIETHSSKNYGLTPNKKQRILDKLNEGVGFEQFLDAKFTSTKRFSLEGGDTTIPALDALINRSAIFGTQEVTIGMAHRGRLNVLCNILGKTYKQVLGEFEGKFAPDEDQKTSDVKVVMGSGDVKYHLGFSSQITTPEGNDVYLRLLPNPSHLECAAPVVQGYTRAKIDLTYGGDVNKVLPITIHGDAAIAGQGVVYETLQMSGLEGYATGGTVHFIINNQIGFTTVFEDARTGNYCTSLAAMTNSPVLHINGNDPEAVVWAMEFAADYRQTFHNDIFIDMVCYRKWGHNEGEDAGYTNLRIFKEVLVNYKDIKDYYEKENPRDLYAARLIAEKVITPESLEAMKSVFREHLQHDLDDVKQDILGYTRQPIEKAWRELKRGTFTEADFENSPKTAVEKAVIEKILTHLNRKPDNFNVYDKVDRLLKGLTKSIEADKLDWGTCELLAYGSLLLEGYDVRMSGQDVKRGTFSHRQSVFFDTKEELEYNRISDIAADQGQFRIFNSLLSEFAVMGFEYGYSLATPNSLVVWEGQFGDFFNGAQTIVDQFIVAGETKWKRQSGLVLLLPHGMEGQGPEHSSGRMERFLQQCAEWNITIANASTPANMFHLLRRQLHRNFRKPLVVFTPKSLLRDDACTSPVADFTTGGFQEVLDDVLFMGDRIKNAKNVKRLILCSGKVYYDLLKQRTELGKTDVALVRVEQLYPFPQTQIDAILAKYKQAKLVWVQEEAENMGAARHLLATFRPDLHVIARPAAAAPAVGFMAVHKTQQADLMAAAFAY